MQEKEYSIFIRSDNRAICPECSGLLLNSTTHLNCVDCGNTYIPTGETGYSERIMQYRRMPRVNRRVQHG